MNIERRRLVLRGLEVRAGPRVLVDAVTADELDAAMQR